MNNLAKKALAAGSLSATLAIGVLIGHATADQPHMQNALDNLLRARAELEIALPDKGGHRVAAIGHVDRAIEETRAGIRYGR
jgi:hypothetical protein